MSDAPLPGGSLWGADSVTADQIAAIKWIMKAIFVFTSGSKFYFEPHECSPCPPRPPITSLTHFIFIFQLTTRSFELSPSYLFVVHHTCPWPCPSYLRHLYTQICSSFQKFGEFAGIIMRWSLKVSLWINKCTLISFVTGGMRPEGTAQKNGKSIVDFSFMTMLQHTSWFWSWI